MDAHTSDAPYDLAVLGGGSAGSACAAEAVKLGHSRVLVVNDGELGGLCILRGCMPTKTLLHPADLVHELHRAQDFGIQARVDRIDLAVLQERRAALVQRFQRGKVAAMEGGGYEIADGRARFVAPDAIEVTHGAPSDNGTRRRVTARAFLVATGSRHHVPDVPGLAESGFWTSDDALLAAEAPTSLAIFGSGAVGLEFASYFAALGTEVTMLVRSDVLHRGEDAELSAAYRAALEHVGIRVVVQARPSRVERGDGGFRIEYERGGESPVLESERLLVATGRVPNLAQLDLDVAGVHTRGGRPELDPALRSTNPRIFFAGDATGERLILHTGNAEGRHVARNLKRSFADEPLVPWRERVPLSAIFTHPPYAECGMTESQALAQGIDVVGAKKEWSSQGRGIVMGAEPGATFVKLVAERPSSRLIGCQILGPRADDLVHVVSTAMFLGGTARDLVGMPWYHPTLSEAFIELARELVRQCERKTVRAHS